MVFQQNLLKKSYFVAKMSGPAGQFLLLESALSFPPQNWFTIVHCMQAMKHGSREQP